MDLPLVEIGTVARELGVAPSTLRTWERRYHIVIPQRGKHGQRLYEPEQIMLLRRVAAQIRRGVRARAAHDIAVVPIPLRTSHVRLEPSTQAPDLARRAVDGLLGDDARDTRFAFSLRLVASELVNNAVLHGSRREPIKMDLKLFRDGAELKVQNGGGRLTIKSLRSKRREGGHGLEIVDALAASWTIDVGPRGTKITVRLGRAPADAEVLVG